MSIPIDAVRGIRDILPDEQRAMQRVQGLLQAVLRGYGYLPIDLPVLEHRDLYLRKMGEELVGKVYEFTSGGRNLALRPEWTASVLRSYVAHMQEHPLPIRLSYSGPVFRYQRPQRLTQRQFVQTGVELIGGLPPRGDAEVLALACEGLDAVGIQNYEIRLAHIGVVREVLLQMGLAERTQLLLLWSLEKMQAQGVDAVRSYLDELIGEPPIDPSILEGLDDQQVIRLMTGMLQHIGVNLSLGTRPPEDIVERLVRKLRRDDSPSRIERALDVLWRLSQIQGEATTALEAASTLLAQEDLHAPALLELRSIIHLLETHGLPSERFIINFGMGRGLHYYTGFIFEMYDTSNMQLCGGGRYDDLVLALGGNRSVPAVGFAYGMERVLAASNLLEEQVTEPRVLVLAVSEDDYAYALDVAQQLRGLGYIATVDVRGRNVSSNLSYASRTGLPAVVIVGADERARQEVVWRDLATHSEQRIQRQAIVPAVQVFDG